MARLVASKLSAPLGQQVIVDNRGGGGGNIGARAVAKAAPDGYTLLLGGAGSVTINPSLDPNSGYTARDFAPIGRIASMPVVITVHPSLAVHSVADVIALAKRQAGKLNVGTPNRGWVHIWRPSCSRRWRVSSHAHSLQGRSAAHQRSPRRPYRDRLQHRPAGARQHPVGNLRPIAVTSATRTSLLPDVPTVAESGCQGSRPCCIPAVAPAGTRDPSSTEGKSRICWPRTKRRNASPRTVAILLPARRRDETYIARETAKWSALIRRLDLKVNWTCREE